MTLQWFNDWIIKLCVSILECLGAPLNFALKANVIHFYPWIPASVLPRSPRCPASGLFWGHYTWGLMRCSETEHCWMVPRCWCGARKFPSAFQVSAHLILRIVWGRNFTCWLWSLDDAVWSQRSQALCPDHQLEMGDLGLNPGNWDPESPSASPSSCPTGICSRGLYRTGVTRSSPSPFAWNSAELRGFPGGTSSIEPACQCRRYKKCGFDSWVGKIPWRKAWQPTPVFLPRKSQG